MTESNDAAVPRIAIVGMAGRFPGAADVDALWRMVRDGASGLTRFTEPELRAAGVSEAHLRDPAYVPVKGALDDAEGFDAAPFGMSAREAEATEHQHRVFLECALAALEDAGYAARSASQLVGVFAGCGASDPTRGPRDDGDHQRAFGEEKDFLATRVSHKLDLRGPSVTVQSACSTSLVSVALACQNLLAFQCDVALAGGVALSAPLRGGYLHRPGMVLSPDGRCRPFDADAAGTVPGDGVGVVVLRRLDDALADGDTVLAVLCGVGLSNDGAAKQSFSAPGVEGQAAAIAHALAMAAFDPATISYVEAHGTGTPLGDPIEVAALTRAFGSSAPRGGCALGSVKSVIGHLDAAAGVAGLIKVVQMLRHRELPPSPYLQRANPRLALDASPFVVHATGRPWRANGPLRAGVSSFGVGGTNAHVVLEEAPEAPAATATARPQLLTLSAATPTALDAIGAALAEHLTAHPEVPLADVAFTLHTGRRALRYRRAIVCADATAAREALTARGAGAQSDGHREVVFLFPGHGAGYADMGRALYEDHASFRADLDEGFALLRARADLDLRAALFPTEPARETAVVALTHGALGQPATFLVSWALGRLLLSWGVRPRAMLGHSLGEYAAACLAGVLSLPDALELVARRGALLARTPPGAMLAVALPPDDLAPLLRGSLALAAHNGPARCVAAGSRADVAALEATLTARGVECRSLAVPHGFHSPLMDDIVAPLVAAARRIPLRAPQIPVVSCLTGDLLRAEEARDPAYWGRHLREPVRFDAALRRLCEVPDRVLVEVGPGDTLTSLARHHPAITVCEALTTVRRARDGRSESERLLDTAGRLWVLGAEIDLARLHDGARRQRTRLPTYPFERTRYASAPRAVSPSAATASPTTSSRDVGDWFHRPTWCLAPRAASPRLPAGECLVFVVDDELARAVVSRLPAARVTLVRPGARFECSDTGAFTLRPDAFDDYAALVDALTRSGRLPDHVLHLWSTDPDARSVDSELDRGLLSASRLLRALGATPGARALRMLMVTRGAQPAAGARVDHPARAMVFAFPHVVTEEYPHARCGAVDLADADDPVALLDELAALDEPVAPTAIALRREGRFELRFEPARVAQATPVAAVRPRGACVITGGLGGVGLVLARHLASTPGARLALIGRTGLPPRSLWPEILEGHDAPDPDSLAYRVREVVALERLGAEVLVLAADVANETEMRRALDVVRARFGGVGGVVHAAGVASGGVIQRQTEDAVRAALAPKVQGTRVLTELTRDDALEFFALCSSLTAIGGGFGQLAYSAANRYLDATAHDLRARGVAAVSIDWDGWGEVGMAARAARPNRHSSEAHPTLGGRVHHTATRSLHRRRLDADRDWILREHRLFGRPTLPGTAYIELARAAAADVLGEGPLVLRDLTLLAPLTLSEGESVALWTSVARSAEELTIELHAGDGASSRLHARCTAAALDAPEPARVAVETLADGCIDERSPDAVFAARRGALEFGPRWRCVARLRTGPTHAVAELDAPGDIDGALSPAVLDQALGCAAHLVAGALLPHSYGAIRVYGPLRGRVFSRARLVEAGARASRFAVTVYDALGATRVEVDDYCLVAARHPKEGA